MTYHVKLSNFANANLQLLVKIATFLIRSLTETVVIDQSQMWIGRKQIHIDSISQRKYLITPIHFPEQIPNFDPVPYRTLLH